MLRPLRNTMIGGIFWISAFTYAQTDVGNFRVPDVDENGVLKSIMTGENAKMFPDKPMIIEGLVIEFYEKDGETVNIRLTSPGCEYDTRANYATSEKPVKIEGSEFTVEGEGYTFDSNTSRMEIHNKVRVVFKNSNFTSPRTSEESVESTPTPTESSAASETP